MPLIPNPYEEVKEDLAQAAEDWLVDLAGKAGQSAQLTMEKAATFWVTGVKSPQLTYPTDAEPYVPASTVAYLWDRLDWYVAGLAVLSIFVAAGKMAWQRSGAPFWELLQSILTLIVVSSAGVATISLLTTASDEAASYILKNAMTTPNGQPTNFQTAFGAMFAVPTPTSGTAFALVGLMALVWIASVLQIVLLIVRGGMLFLLAGVLPLAAAATNTETGRQWFRKTVAWVVAFILYKPVAAIVYATAFQLTREGGPSAPTPGDQIIKVITGLTMCVLALFALPALLRFTVPAVAAVAGSGGPGAGLALGGALATGAKNALARSYGGTGGGGGGKSNPPSKPPTPSSGSVDGPKGGSVPSGKSLNGQLDVKPATGPVAATATAAAGSAGSVATAGAVEGLNKASDTANSAPSQAAGEDALGRSAGRVGGASKGGGHVPAGGSPSSKAATSPATTPPAAPAGDGIGPSGSQSGKKSTPPASTKPVSGTGDSQPSKTPSLSSTEGPSGGKR